MRQFYHSYYSRPAQEYNRWGISQQFLKNLWCAALSVEYMHKHNREIILSCNSVVAKQILTAGIKYDDVIPYLDNLKISNYFWAGCKIFTQQFMEKGDVHIDMDVFFLSDKCLNMIEQYEWDVVNQELEITALDYKHDGNWYKRHFDFLRENGINIKPNPYSLNCGVIGFNNDKIKQQYIKEYFNLVKEISRLDATKYEGGVEFFAPDLICEQMNLCNIIDKNKGNVLLLRPNNEYVADYRNDYLHLIGQTKYSEENQNWIKEKLKEMNPNLFDKLNTMLQ